MAPFWTRFLGANSIWTQQITFTEVALIVENFSRFAFCFLVTIRWLTISSLHFSGSISIVTTFLFTITSLYLTVATVTTFLLSWLVTTVSAFAFRWAITAVTSFFFFWPVPTITALLLAAVAYIGFNWAIANACLDGAISFFLWFTVSISNFFFYRVAALMTVTARPFWLIG